MSNKKRILLAEDNATLALLLKIRIEKEGYTSMVAENGKKAIELIESEHPEFSPNEFMVRLRRFLN